MRDAGRELGEKFVRDLAAEAPCAREAGYRLARAGADFDQPFPVPAYPPRAWFYEKPDWLEPGQRLTVVTDGPEIGRVAGYYFDRDSCILDGTATCWRPPPSPSGFDMFHQGNVETEDGEIVRVGVVGQTGGHASPFTDIATTQAHYGDPSRQRLLVRAFDDLDNGGAYVVGAVAPNLTYGDIAEIRRSSLSGDWRIPPGTSAYDLVGVCLVNQPGFALQLEARTAVVTGATIQPEEPVLAAVTASRDLPLSSRDRTWDAGAARARLRGDSDTPDQRYKAAHLWQDGDGSNFTDFKLPFADVIDGTLTAVWSGITAAAGRLDQTDISADAKEQVRGVLASYYKKAANKFNDPSITPPWQASATLSTVQLTLHDGTRLDVPENYALVASANGFVVRQAQPPMPPSPNGEEPAEPAAEGESGPSLEEIAAQHEEMRTRLDGVEAVVEELVSRVESIEVAADLDSLDAEAVTLPE